MSASVLQISSKKNMGTDGRAGRLGGSGGGGEDGSEDGGDDENDENDDGGGGGATYGSTVPAPSCPYRICLALSFCRRMVKNAIRQPTTTVRNKPMATPMITTCVEEGDPVLLVLLVLLVLTGVAVDVGMGFSEEGTSDPVEKAVVLGLYAVSSPPNHHSKIAR